MPEAENNVCDFCGDPAHWDFPCRDFKRPEDWLVIGIHADNRVDVKSKNFTFDSDGGWKACEVCAALINRGAREKLTRRSAKKHIKTHNLPVALGNFIDLLRPLHDDFWRNREGPATRLS